MYSECNSNTVEPFKKDTTATKREMRERERGREGETEGETERSSYYKISCHSSQATNVTIRIPVPKSTVSSSHEPLGPGQAMELKLSEKCFVWKCKKINGGEEMILLLKVCT